jgi:hypothetical protein
LLIKRFSKISFNRFGRSGLASAGADKTLDQQGETTLSSA